MGHLALATPSLQRRALYQACLLAVFSLFWATVPLLLTGAAVHMSQGGVALSALPAIGIGFALPIAGFWFLSDGLDSRPLVTLGRERLKASAVPRWPRAPSMPKHSGAE